MSGWRRLICVICGDALLASTRNGANYSRKEDRMKWFVDLVVHGNSDALGQLIATIESRLQPNWHRDLEAEKQVARHTDSRRYFIRCRRPSDDIEFALAQYPGIICVDNVFILPGKCLTAPEYSELLEDFFWRVVKPAADQLGLKCFSSGFEDRSPEWAKRRHRRPSAIEIALGFSVALRLRTEGYIDRFPFNNETTGVPIDRQSVARRLLEIYPLCQN